MFDSRVGRTWIRPPDTGTSIVFRTVDGNTDLLVVGPRGNAAYVADKIIPRCARVRVRPGWAAELIGAPVDQLTGQIVPLEQLWGADVTNRLADEFDADPRA